MNNRELEILKIDLEDLEYLLEDIEKSFDIDFYTNELKDVNTFGELTDSILNKINKKGCDDCTSQQAYYKLRDAFVQVMKIDKEEFTPDSNLSLLIPKRNRAKRIREIEEYIGLRLNIIGLSILTIIFLITVLIVGILIPLEEYVIKATFIISSLTMLLFPHKYGRRFKIKSVRDLVIKITRENYSKSRRDENTVNREEIETIISDWISDTFLIDREKLTSKVRFR